MKRWIRVLAFAAAAALWGTAPGAQTAYTAAELRQKAAEAARAGDIRTALTFTEALIKANPSDIDSLILRSRIMQAIGERKTALDTAKLAWAAARTKAQKYVAAREVAAVLHAQKHHTRAQFWLRRAGQAAPDAQTRAQAIRDFRTVQGVNPLSFSLSFNIAPTSNINGGTTSDFVNTAFTGNVRFVPLNGAQALSGTERSASVSAQYRLSVTQSAATFLTAHASHTSYVLSREAQRDLDAFAAANPTARVARASDYEENRLAFGLAQNRLLAEQDMMLSWGATALRHWYGGAPLYDSLIGNVALRKAMSETTQATVAASLEKQFGHGARPDADILSGSAGLSTQLRGKDRLTLSLGATRSRSDAVYADYTEKRIGLSYDLGSVVWGTGFGFDLSASRRFFEANQITTGSRTDDTFTASVTATFNTLEYMGFVPTLTLSRRKTDSNVPNFDTGETGVYFGVKSSF